MPDPIKITLKNKTYTTPILNGEMDTIAQQIIDTKNTIKGLNEHITEQTNTLNNLNYQFMTMYIQQTGSFPQ
jgi:hypothetical protein